MVIPGGSGAGDGQQPGSGIESPVRTISAGTGSQGRKTEPVFQRICFDRRPLPASQDKSGAAGGEGFVVNRNCGVHNGHTGQVCAVVESDITDGAFACNGGGDRDLCQTGSGKRTIPDGFQTAGECHAGQVSGAGKCTVSDGCDGILDDYGRNLIVIQEGRLIDTVAVIRNGSSSADRQHTGVRQCPADAVRQLPTVSCQGDGTTKDCDQQDQKN